MSERRPLGANYRKLFGSAVAANLGDGMMSIAMVWLASATPGTNWVSGEYYVKHKPGRTNKQAADPALAEQLWERSLDMISTQN